MKRTTALVAALVLCSAGVYAATQERLPTGNGANVAWTSSSGGNTWNDIDDPIGSPDEDVTYVSRATSGGTHQWTFSAISITSSSITSVEVVARCKEIGGDITLQPTIRVQGVSRFGTTFSTTTSYADYTTTSWSLNPNTSAAWTEADVEGTGTNNLQQFGVSSASQAAGETMRCTQVYLVVTYVDAVTGTTRQALTGAGI